MSPAPGILSRCGFLTITSSMVLTACQSSRITVMPTTAYSALLQLFPSGRVLYARDDQMRLPAASIVKLLIAIALIRHSARSLGTGFAIARRQCFGTVNRYFSGAVPGTHLPLRKLLTLMIEQSDNFSANVLIEHLGIADINNTARACQLRETRINGLFYDIAAPLLPGTYTTARDCNRMLSTILSGARATGDSAYQDSYRSLLDMMLRQSDRRFIPAVINPSVPVANKTGEIHGELNDTAIIRPFAKEPALFTLLTFGNFSIQDQDSLYYAAVGQAINTAKEIYDRNALEIRQAAFR